MREFIRDASYILMVSFIVIFMWRLTGLIEWYVKVNFYETRLPQDTISLKEFLAEWGDDD